MKTRLLRRVRKRIKLHEENGNYFVYKGNLSIQFKNKEQSVEYYREEVIKEAVDIFNTRLNR